VISTTCRLAGHARPWIPALAVFAVPVTWPIAGLGLSEMPAILALSISVLCLVRWLNARAGSQWRLCLWASFAGLALGIASLGRQNSLALCAVPAMFALRNRRMFPSAILYASVACAVVAPVLWIWGGMTPPTRFHVAMGLSLSNALLSLGYAGAILFILAPRFFPWKPLWGAVLLLSAIGTNSVLPILRITPFHNLAVNLGPVRCAVYSWLASGVLLGVAISVLAVLAYRAWTEREPCARLGVAGVFWIALTSLAVTNNYSSRYTALALPLFVIAAEPYAPVSRWRIARLVLGATLGALSLRTYYQTPGWELGWPEVFRRGFS
jgi:hypothetical protein